MTHSLDNVKILPQKKKKKCKIDNTSFCTYACIKGYLEPTHLKSSLKPPFLRDTENGRNSRNQGVENGKWQVSFSEMIRLIFVQNLSQFGRAFNEMLGKVYLLPTFPSKCCFICLLGSYFCSLNALFGSAV